MLRHPVPPALKAEAIQALNEYRDAIMKVGEATHTDHTSNIHYVNIIFEIGFLIKELKNADSN